jgi:hypothetical protein
VLTRTAGAGVVLAIIFGALLFITRASEYVASNLFIAKMVFVGLGAANALALRMPAQAPVPEMTSGQWKFPARFRLAAGISLASWLAALTLGRLVGYF